MSTAGRSLELRVLGQEPWALAACAWEGGQGAITGSRTQCSTEEAQT